MVQMAAGIDDSCPIGTYHWTEAPITLSPIVLLIIVLLPLVTVVLVHVMLNNTREKVRIAGTGPHFAESTDNRRVPNTGNVNSARTASINFAEEEFQTPLGLPRSISYRIEEEANKMQSSEYTRRGMLWTKQAAWHLNNAPRASVNNYLHGPFPPGVERIRSILMKYDVDLNTGFLPSQDPLQRLPYARYHIWEDLGDDLPKLLGARLGQARAPLRQLPPLATDQLVTNAELKRAHLLLCLFAHAYIWGGSEPLDSLPVGISKPLWEVSEKLHIPPVLGHPSIVLYNWRRLDAGADICMENLSTLNNFFNGRDESWFYLITVEVEARGAAAILPIMLAIDSIQRFNSDRQANPMLISPDRYSERSLRVMRQSKGSASSSRSASRSQRNPAAELVQQHDGNHDTTSSDEDSDREDDGAIKTTAGAGAGTDDDGNVAIVQSEALGGELHIARLALYVTLQLEKVLEGIKGMNNSMSNMREGCHPFIFYHRVRPFLSGWKHNPTLPLGVLYEGVSEQRQLFYGGSAAQSALLPLLDIALGVKHESAKSREFLMAMRGYMLQPHREFLEYVESVACIEAFIEEAVAVSGLHIHSKTASSSTETSTDTSTDTTASAAAGAIGNTDMDKTELQRIVRQLCLVYDECLAKLRHFRTIHITLVKEYIMAQQTGRKPGESGIGKLEGSAGGKGTGGTDLMNFLKPIRDDCDKRVLNGASSAAGAVRTDANEASDERKATDVSKHAQVSSSNSSSSSSGWEDNQQPDQDKNSPIAAAARTPAASSSSSSSSSPVVNGSAHYIKDNGCFEDIDLFRGSRLH